MQGNTKRMVDILAKLITTIKAIEKERELNRIKFDHYRLKTAKLQKHAASSDAKKLDKYSRNMKKFDEAKQKFNESTHRLETVMH